MGTPPSAAYRNSTASTSALPPAALSIYLASPLFWENEVNTGSAVGRLALDILTAPRLRSTSSTLSQVGGRMSVNYRQDRTSLATFRAKMAVGSWFGTPLLSDVAKLVDMIEGKGETEKPLGID
ncbi:hypothetical protein RHS03_09014, partial [Rhizoctonia solani]